MGRKYRTLEVKGMITILRKSRLRKKGTNYIVKTLCKSSEIILLFTLK